MVKYDERGNPIDAAYGNYKPRDVRIFRSEGFVEVSRELAVKVGDQLAKKLETETKPEVR